MELKLRFKVVWRMLFKRKKNDKTDYMQRGVLDNFIDGSRDGGVGAVVVLLVTNPNNSIFTNAIIGNDSMGLVIRLNEGRGFGSWFQRNGSCRWIKNA
jgi:hypothetical protein